MQKEKAGFDSGNEQLDNGNEHWAPLALCEMLLSRMLQHNTHI